MDPYEHQSREEMVTRSKRAWARAAAVSVVLSISKRDAYRWMKHWRKDGVGIEALIKAEPQAVARARATMERLKEPEVVKVERQTPLQRSVKKAARAHEDPDPAVAKETKKARRQRVQIMLWAIGKCGSTDLARDAFDRAMRAMEDDA